MADGEIMKKAMTMAMALMLAGCGMSPGAGALAPLPATTGVAREIQRYQTAGLTRIKSVSVWVYGGPVDAETAIQAKARAARADYYAVVFNHEVFPPGRRHAYAILYAKAR